MIDSAESAIAAWLHQRDQAAAAWLVHEHRSLVLGTARRWGVPAEMEQDAVQEVFLRVFNKLHLFRPENAFAHWLSAIARNTCAKLRRHWCHRHRLSAVFEGAAVEVTDVELPHSRSPDREAACREDLAHLQRAMGSLNPRERQIIEQQLSAETVPPPAPSVAARVALSRARSHLRHLLSLPDDERHDH